MVEEERVRKRYRIAGRVQGVGFRVWTVRHAAALGVRGTVRNAPDGSVEVEAEGSAEAVGRLEEMLRQGPTLARVEEVTELAASRHPLSDRFEVSY